MTDPQLDAIEAAVGFRLPAEYRRACLACPFRPIGRDSIYWFFDTPDQVIGGTLAPLEDGEYDGAGWRPGYLTIGRDAAGDLFVMDTTAEGLPVLLLSHETHACEPGFETFDAFVSYWIRAPEEIERTVSAQIAATRTEQDARIRKGLIVAGIIVAVSCMISLVPMLIFWLTGRAGGR